tara:strand:+ start:420 stop:707 length:288 start_codon:yes stop_codon:yes gene_type:complete
MLDTTMSIVLYYVHRCFYLYNNGNKMKVYIKWIALDHHYTMSLDVSDYDTEKQSSESLLAFIAAEGKRFVRWEFVNRSVETYGHRIRIESLINGE